ncbi:MULTISPECIES: histidine phosphatase family protein [Microbacterium]|uniref:Histidine phosphatase family protein n=1 Tax=Microbacterium wangchenii TaxID=2541726 RepID=A0ABX5SSG6_9MICO|nr:MULTISPECIES: histidine phosphatase family protein [Microbacterium]MCK6066775.1 histidine phosphatase family protein [Microbacterium sp. EYE_512]QBR88093.1 histidine phosphatase family protein [Microbacterium wangchenii]TFV83787.1 histidine phosphatase family protein [Microbacterium sp. dk485]TXK18117.1 histidine phosphatase family protein [Microbacterium wangchenii]
MVTRSTSDRQVHLVRHGEVDNPGGVVYGRLEGFPLTDRGRHLAALAAEELAGRHRPIAALFTSPLLRAKQSADPIAHAFALSPQERVGLLEATSLLEGKAYDVSLSILARPSAWRYLVNPFRPSWGEPFADVAVRMGRELQNAFAVPGEGDVVMVSHQLPIWITHRVATGRRLAHDPRRRRCALSSITSFQMRDDRLTEVGYWCPPAA